MQKPIEYRPMRLQDLAQIESIEKASFSMPWSMESLLHELDEGHGAHYIVAACGDEVFGYAGFWQVFDEDHITNVAVRPDQRRQGIAEQMMLEMDVLCRKLGILYQTLEVRVSNEAARNLYHKLGFVSAGIRPGYYEKPKEDADILWKEVPL